MVLFQVRNQINFPEKCQNIIENLQPFSVTNLRDIDGKIFTSWLKSSVRLSETPRISGKPSL